MSKMTTEAEHMKAHRAVADRPKQWNMGTQSKKRSVSFQPAIFAMVSALEMRFLWVSCTPFGTPVVPEVRRMQAISVGSSASSRLSKWE